MACKLGIAGQQTHSLLLRPAKQQLVKRVLVRERLYRFGGDVMGNQRQQLLIHRCTEGHHRCRVHRTLPHAGQVEAVPFQPQLPNRHRRKHDLVAGRGHPSPLGSRQGIRGEHRPNGDMGVEETPQSGMPNTWRLNAGSSKLAGNSTVRPSIPSSRRTRAAFSKSMPSAFCAEISSTKGRPCLVMMTRSPRSATAAASVKRALA
jgi:hypothetical protein